MAFAHPDHSEFSETEPYMTPQHLDYFRTKLMDFREQVHRRLSELTREMQREEANPNEFLDRAENDRFRGHLAEECIRCRRMLEASEAALIRIGDGYFGYCMETGEEIGLRRLETVPYATLCVQAQERLERGIGR